MINSYCVPIKYEAALDQELHLFYIHYHIIEQLVFLFYMQKLRLREARNSLKTM